MKFLRTGIVSSVLLAVCVLVVACGARTSDEQQVRDLVLAAGNAAEARDASEVLEVVATDYSDSQGLDRAQLQTFLRGYFLANPRVEVRADVQDLQFPVEGLAHARIDVAVLPAGDRATLQVEFRKQDGKWRVARADRIRE